MKKCLFVLLILVIAASVFTALMLLVIGEPADIDTLAIRVEEGVGQLTIHIQTTDSAMAISHIGYQYDNAVLNMTVRKVLCSPLYRSGEKCLYFEITDETEIRINGISVWTK